MINGMVSFRLLYQQINRSSAPILWKINTKQIINNRTIILPYNVYPKPITYSLAIYPYNGESLLSRIGSQPWPTCGTIRLVPNRFDRLVAAEYLARWTHQWVANKSLWNPGAPCSKLTSSSNSNSRIIGIYPAASARRYVTMSQPYKNDIFFWNILMVIFKV